MTKRAEDLEKSKDEANGGGGGRVPPSIFEHGHEQSSSWSFFENPFELPQQASTRSSFLQPDISYSDPPKHSTDSPGYSDPPPKHSADSPGYYFDPPKCLNDSPGYPDSPHPLSYYYIGFPEPLYASSSVHPYNDEMHPETEEEASSSYTRSYCESSDRLLLLPTTPITPKFYSYGNSYCGQSTFFPQEFEDYPQFQFSKSASTKIDDYFQLFS